MQTIKQILSDDIEGLNVVEDFITADEEQELIKFINLQEWDYNLTRRTQQYGFKYNYKKRNIDLEAKIGELPSQLNDLAFKLFNMGYISEIPDQVIINEYEPGEGIAPHIDCEPCFGETVISISLLSDIVMDFSNDSKSYPIHLKKRSMVALNGDARYKFKHGIAKRRSDKINNKSVKRGIRISLTFRKVIIS